MATRWSTRVASSTSGREAATKQLVVGGHFWEVADQTNDDCGRRLGNQAPDDECQTRKGITAYSFSGRLEPNWNPMYAASYSLVWALHVDGE